MYLKLGMVTKVGPFLYPHICKRFIRSFLFAFTVWLVGKFQWVYIKLCLPVPTWPFNALFITHGRTMRMKLRSSELSLILRMEFQLRHTREAGWSHQQWLLRQRWGKIPKRLWLWTTQYSHIFQTSLICLCLDWLF